MVRRQIVSKRQRDVFKSVGRVVGVRVVVSRVGTVGRGFDGAYETTEQAAVYELTSIGDADCVPVTGYLLPATFTVAGLPFDLTYDVGYVDDGKRRRYGVTRIEAGRPDPVATLRQPAKAGVNLERITEAALVRLALSASKVGGYAYAPGSVIDIRTDKVIDRLNIGDAMPNGATVLGVTVKGGRVVGLEGRPETRLTHRLPEGVEPADFRVLAGQRPPGRRKGQKLNDADLRLVARLFTDAYADPTVRNVPETVRMKLIEATNGRLHYSESWIRARGVEARKRGFLKHGQRNKRKARR